MSSHVEKIKERLGISEVVSSYLKIEKAGANFKAKCPFHNEKTASFFISPDRGTYYCFGCGAKGDIFSFVQEFEGVEFKEALSMLALRAGVELIPEKKEVRDENKNLLNLLEDSVEFFVDRLAQKDEVVSYLKKRGLTEGTIETWQIGYAPNEWRSLYSFLLEKGVTAEQMFSVGLIKKNEKGSGEPYYDTFRDRIMFPLFDQKGTVVGFSGRIFTPDEKSPKYLNSPETKFFNKSEFLYGLDRAKMAIRKQDYSIVVEGQFDLIMSHQAGFLNTVASSGTAFSDRHIKKLQSLSNRIMFAFDGDSAGFVAVERSATLALSLGMEVKIVSLPEGDDPASLILKNPKMWRDLVSTSKHIVDFYTDSLIASGISGRNISKQIKEKVLPFVLLVSSAIERSHFVKSISEKTNIKEEAIWDDLKALSKQIRPEIRNPKFSNQNGELKRHTVARSILGLVFWQETVRNTSVKVPDILKRLEELIGKERLEKLRSELYPDKDKLIFEIEQYFEGSDSLEDHIEELFERLTEEKLKDELAETITAMRVAEKGNDANLARQLLEHCQEISTKLSAIKHKV